MREVPGPIMVTIKKPRLFTDAARCFTKEYGIFVDYAFADRSEFTALVPLHKVERMEAAGVEIVRQ